MTSGLCREALRPTCTPDADTSMSDKENILPTFTDPMVHARTAATDEYASNTQAVRVQDNELRRPEQKDRLHHSAWSSLKRKRSQDEVRTDFDGSSLIGLFYEIDLEMRKGHEDTSRRLSRRESMAGRTGGDLAFTLEYASYYTRGLYPAYSAPRLNTHSRSPEQLERHRGLDNGPCDPTAEGVRSLPSRKLDRYWNNVDFHASSVPNPLLTPAASGLSSSPEANITVRSLEGWQSSALFTDMEKVARTSECDGSSGADRPSQHGLMSDISGPAQLDGAIMEIDERSRDTFLPSTLRTTANEPAHSDATQHNTLDSLSSVVMSATKNEHFVEQVRSALKPESKWKTPSVRRRQARRILKLLDLATLPNDTDALFLSGEKAARYVEPSVSFPGPIVVEDQQALPLQTVAQFLDEYYDDSAKVSIQDPSMVLTKSNSGPFAKEITIGQLKQRFSSPTKPRIPWNCLELAAHVEDGLRPAFLNHEDCRLLTKIKLPSSNDSASRRGYEPGWKEVEKWALLAQAGALTEPHQDSHGYSTYITANQGRIGFGWLSNPTPDERRAWREHPGTFTGGSWRYVVLQPGQTVFFPSGTVHFVFRLASDGDTLAFGGHVLRCSQIVRWVKTMLEEKEESNITNEYLTVSAPAWLERVERFVKQAQKTGQVNKWGGDEGIREFLRAKEEFVSDEATEDEHMEEA